MKANQIVVKIEQMAMAEGKKGKSMKGTEHTIIVEETLPTFSPGIFHNLCRLKEVFCSKPLRKVVYNCDEDSVTITIERCRNCYACYKYVKYNCI